MHCRCGNCSSVAAPACHRRSRCPLAGPASRGSPARTSWHHSSCFCMFSGILCSGTWPVAAGGGVEEEGEALETRSTGQAGGRAGGQAGGQALTRPLVHNLHIPLPGPPGQLPLRRQLSKLGGVVRVCGKRRGTGEGRRAGIRVEMWGGGKEGRRMCFTVPLPLAAACCCSGSGRVPLGGAGAHTIGDAGCRFSQGCPPLIPPWMQPGRRPSPMLRETSYCLQYRCGTGGHGGQGGAGGRVLRHCGAPLAPAGAMRTCGQAGKLLLWSGCSLHGACVCKARAEGPLFSFFLPYPCTCPGVFFLSSSPAYVQDVVPVRVRKVLLVVQQAQLRR